MGPGESEWTTQVTKVRKHLEQIKSEKASLLDVLNVRDTLGTGTFGRVRLVRVDGLVKFMQSPEGGGEKSFKTEFYALKMMKKTEVVRLKQVEHIKNEKDILHRINHPFIVTMFASFQDDVSLYMLLEYIIGGELFTHLRKQGKFSNDHGRFYATQIILAFEYLHEDNIVYRDLKPENLLLDAVGYIKITDFGFAKVVTDRTWTLCGTPEYLAPEIIQSKGHGKGVDWWALGVLVYEMIAGYPPFYDENPFGIYQKILAGRLEFPRHFETHARDLVRKLLTADRTKRLGILKGGAEDVKKHKWNRGVNWHDVFNKRLEAFFVPEVRAPDDTSQYDEYPDSDETQTPLLAKEKDLEFFGSF